MLTPSTCVLIAAIALSQSEYSAFIIAFGNFRAAPIEPWMAAHVDPARKAAVHPLVDGEEKPACRNDSFTQVSGDQPLPDGERAKWVCKAKRGRKFTEIQIGPKTYDLADGRLFLLSGKGSDVKVLQLDRDPFKLGAPELLRLAKDDPKVREFFGK